MDVRKIAAIACASIMALSAGAQTVSLADLRFETVGYFPEGEDKPRFLTAGTLAGRFLPVEWMRLRARADLYIDDTEAFFYSLNGSTTPGFLVFEGADASFPSVAGGPLSVTVFTGYLDDPASASLLRELLKVTVDEPEFHGMPAGTAFSPETEIRGTGFGLTGIPNNANMAAGLYGYWNTCTDDDAAYTLDLRFGFIRDILVMNLFTGVTLLADDVSFSYRGGATALMRSGGGHELYVEAGIRGLEAGMDEAGKNLYLLFEPRLHLGMTDVVLSFFSSPVFPENLPQQAVEAESNYLGFNGLIAWGRLDLERMRGGISVLGCLDPEDPGTVTPFSFSVSPFYSVRLSDYVINVTAVVKPLLFDDPREAVELRLLLKAVY